MVIAFEKERFWKIRPGGLFFCVVGDVDLAPLAASNCAKEKLSNWCRAMSKARLYSVGDLTMPDGRFRIGWWRISITAIIFSSPHVVKIFSGQNEILFRRMGSSLRRDNPTYRRKIQDRITFKWRQMKFRFPQQTGERCGFLEGLEQRTFYDLWCMGLCTGSCLMWIKNVTIAQRAMDRYIPLPFVCFRFPVGVETWCDMRL